MKQKLLWLWLLSVTLLLSTVSISRAQYVSVEDTRIDLSASNDNVLAGKGEGRDGCVSYNADTKTLTLKDASLKSREQSGRLFISGCTDTLTIQLIGKNSLYSPSSNTLKIKDSNVRLTGSGSLAVSNSNDGRIVTFSVEGPASSLLIDSTTLTVDGSFQSPAFDATLVVRHSTVKASRTAFKEITLEDCYLSEPAGAFVGTGEDEIGNYQAIASQDGRIAENYVILPGSITMYPIVVNGVAVSSKNKENVLAGQGAGRDGCVSYNEETKTLTLQNAKLMNSSEEGMLYISEFGADTLTINLVGDNYLESNGNTLTLKKSTVRITGGGSLKAISTNSNHMGIAPLGEGANLIISGTTLMAKGGAAIVDPNYGASLTIDNSTVNAEGGIVAKTITLKDCFVELPTGGYMDKGSTKDGTELMGVWDSSSNLALSCVILPESHRSISSVTRSEVVVLLDPISKELHLSGLTAREMVYLVDMMGIKVTELTADEEGVATQSLAQLPAGYYLVVTTSGAHKISITE